MLDLMRRYMSHTQLIETFSVIKFECGLHAIHELVWEFAWLRNLKWLIFRHAVQPKNVQVQYIYMCDGGEAGVCCIGSMLFVKARAGL